MSRRRRLYALFVAALAADVLLNAVAYFHAWFMLHQYHVLGGTFIFCEVERPPEDGVV